MKPIILTQVKFGIREISGFIGHSFADEDREVVEQIKAVLSKLGVVCDSGERPEPKSVSSKVRERIEACELFIGIFTRREALSAAKYSTSSWVIEEKALAIDAGKRLLLFVEDGVEQIGGLQGDYEYVRFERTGLSRALVKAMDYVLAVTKVPVECKVDPLSRQVTLNFGITEMKLDDPIKQLKREIEKQPNNPQLRVNHARLLEQAGDQPSAIAELRSTIAKHPNDWNAHHELAHMLDRSGDLDSSLLHFQKALDAGSSIHKNYHCYGKCLYKKATSIVNGTIKRSTLEKSKRMLEQAITVGGEAHRPGVGRDIFLVDEALRELGRGASRRRASTAATSRGSKRGRRK